MSTKTVDIMDLVFIPFLTRQRFAEVVGVSQDTLERWIRDGRVRTYRIGKRSLVDLRQWVAEGGDQPGFKPSGRIKSQGGES